MLQAIKRLASGFYQSGGLGFGAAAVFVLVMVFERGYARLIPLLAGVLIAIPALFALAAPKQLPATQVNYQAKRDKSSDRKVCDTAQCGTERS